MRSALPLGSSKNYHKLIKNSDAQKFMTNYMHNYMLKTEPSYFLLLLNVQKSEEVDICPFNSPLTPL